MLGLFFFALRGANGRRRRRIERLEGVEQLADQSFHVDWRSSHFRLVHGSMLRSRGSEYFCLSLAYWGKACELRSNFSAKDAKSCRRVLAGSNAMARWASRSLSVAAGSSATASWFRLSRNATES